MDGKASTDNPVNVNVKYEKEVRFALGVAMVTRLDGTVNGLRIPLFDYTEQMIIAEKDWKKKQNEAMSYIKSLANGGQWVQDCREGRMFEDDDDLTLVKGLGKKIEPKLKEEGISDLKILFESLSNPARRDHLIVAISGLSSKKADKWLQILTDAPLLSGTCPPKIDHRKATNPYISRFSPDLNLPPGEEQQWEKEMAKSVICNKVVSINKLIDHIFKQTNKNIHRNDSRK